MTEVILLIVLIVLGWINLFVLFSVSVLAVKIFDRLETINKNQLIEAENTERSKGLRDIPKNIPYDRV
jgi:hypothetical protein